MATKWQDKDMEMRRKFGSEMKKHKVPMTKRSNPMKMVEDGDSNLFLCDKGVDENRDLESQGCINYDEIPVTRHG